MHIVIDDKCQKAQCGCTLDEIGFVRGHDCPPIDPQAQDVHIANVLLDIREKISELEIKSKIDEAIRMILGS